MADNVVQGSAFVSGGAATGAWISVSVGGMGLSFSGTALSLGLTPLTATGAITGAASYGVFRAMVEGDASAVGAAVAGGCGGAGVSLTVGGMGLAFKGTAISLGIAPVTAAGSVVGLAIYGILKILDGAESKETTDDVFSRMEEKISWQEVYNQALIELAEDSLEKKFTELAFEEELSHLKQQLLKDNFSHSKIQKNLVNDIQKLYQQHKLDISFTDFDNVAVKFVEAE